jgi:hypothetical protein
VQPGRRQHPYPWLIAGRCRNSNNSGGSIPCWGNATVSVSFASHYITRAFLIAVTTAGCSKSGFTLKQAACRPTPCHRMMQVLLLDNPVTMQPDRARRCRKQRWPVRSANFVASKVRLEADAEAVTSAACHQAPASDASLRQRAPHTAAEGSRLLSTIWLADYLSRALQASHQPRLPAGVGGSRWAQSGRSTLRG